MSTIGGTDVGMFDGSSESLPPFYIPAELLEADKQCIRDAVNREDAQSQVSHRLYGSMDDTCSAIAQILRDTKQPITEENAGKVYLQMKGTNGRSYSA